MKKVTINKMLATVAGLFLMTSCGSGFLDKDPTDAVNSDLA